MNYGSVGRTVVVISLRWQLQKFMRVIHTFPQDTQKSSNQSIKGVCALARVLIFAPLLLFLLWLLL